MLLLLLVLVAAAAAESEGFKQGNDCSELSCEDRPGTVCEMITFDCTGAPCPPSAECVPRENSCAAKRCGRQMSCIVRRAFCTPGEPDCVHRPACVRFPQCGENEEYRECVGDGDKPCEATCENNWPYCTGCGKGGCVCKSGFLRSAGKCIKYDQCPDPECPENQVWDKCPGNCERKSCRNILSTEKEDCIEGCGFSQCVCAPGFVRDDDDVCVKQESCPKTFDCDSPHEVKKQCSTQCEPTCAERSPACFLQEKCGPPKCQCKPGFVRDQGFCLPSFQCPQF